VGILYKPSLKLGIKFYPYPILTTIGLC
jgi:hypothetical protein